MNPARPGEKITPDEFERVLHQMAKRIEEYRAKYDELRARVDSLIRTNRNEGESQR